MTADQFTSDLYNVVRAMGFVTLAIEEKACPHFQISGSRPNTAVIAGHYCENGDSFIKVCNSGREELTNDEKSSKAFIDLIREITITLRKHGCVEEQWFNKKGKLERSAIEIPLLGGKTYVMGKKPHIWSVGLRPTTRQFAPFV